MERNDDNLGNLGSSMNAGESGTSGSAGGSGLGNTGDLTGTAGYGASGGSYATPGTPASGGSMADAGISYGAGTASTGSTAGSSTDGTEAGHEGLADRARQMASGAGDRLSTAGSAIRERAGTAKNSLADMLEAGAQRLGSQGQSQQLAGATGEGAVAVDGTNRLAAVAGGLQSSADWLREADLDGMRQGIENQVRTNPGRSLLIAVGVGYLLGKALRK
jgi:hypothetical protein